MSRRHFGSAGFSMVETTVAMVIVGVMLVSTLQTVGAVARRRQAAARSDLAHGLAAALLTEVAQARYAESSESPGWGRETGEPATPRADWDDVDDFDGLAETTLRDRSGVPIAGVAGWTRSVQVDLVALSDPAVLSGSDQGLKRITVSVTDPAGRTTTLVTLRSRDSSIDRLPPAATSYLSWVGVDITIGPDPSTAVSTGVNLLNSIPDAGGG